MRISSFVLSELYGVTFSSLSLSVWAKEGFLFLWTLLNQEIYELLHFLVGFLKLSKTPIPERSPLLPFLLQELMNFELLLLLSASLTPGVLEMFWILRFGGRRTLLSTFTCGTSAALEKTILVTSHRWWPPSSASPLARGNKWVCSLLDFYYLSRCLHPFTYRVLPYWRFSYPPPVLLLCYSGTWLVYAI